MASLGLYANRNSHKDFVHEALTNLADPACNVYVAVAFFTDPSIVEHLVGRGCAVRLIVRLGFPTSSVALAKLLDKTSIEVRYFTDRSFHPKLYLFGTRAALVGSANMTDAALWSSQEVCVVLDSTDERLEELAALFNDYWRQAKVLTGAVLQEYSDLCAKYSKVWLQEQQMTNDVLAKMGKVAVANITRDVSKESRGNVFIEDFRKTYQEFVSAFQIIRRVYERIGKRKAHPDEIPLRLEIDGFFTFVRETKATRESWRQAPLLSGKEQESKIESLIHEWHNTHWEYFEGELVPIKYPRIVKIFGSARTIEQASDDELFDALDVVHAFHELLRFALGGHAALQKHFFDANRETQVRESLVYLLYGPGSAEERMANLIFNPDYKLGMFGRSCVQELLGWVNPEDLPVVNGRTTKVLRFLGFDITQLSD